MDWLPATRFFTRTQNAVESENLKGGQRDFPDGRQPGVWLIRVNKSFAKQERFPTNGDTFLHFSWNETEGGRSYLRNYSRLPVRYKWFDPSMVLENMEDIYVDHPQNA